eukprot:383654_1
MWCQIAAFFVVLIIPWVVPSNITVSFQSEAWNMARRKSAYGTYNRQVYMVGGLAGDSTEWNPNTDIVRYNMDTKTTTTLQTAPPYKMELRFPAEQCQIGDNVYYMPVTCAFTGCYFCDGDGGSAGTACFVNTMNLQTQTITQLATAVPVHGRGALCGFISSGEHRLFHVGGQPNDWEGVGTLDTYLYNATTTNWMSMDNLIIATSSAICIGHREFLFLFAGRHTTAIQIYDFKNNQWSQSTQHIADQVMNMIPLPIHDYIFLFGGGLPRSDGDNYGNNAIDTIYVYDIQADKLTKSNQVLTDVTSAAAVGYDEVTGLIHVIGGQTSLHTSLDLIQTGTIDWGLTDAPVTAAPTTPTNMPTKPQINDPTTNPSVSPTVSTVAPSAIPSVPPTQRPTNPPSLQPTTYPTGDPSAAPSLQPTQHPTNPPSLLPSQHPAVTPSISPSNAPSAPTKYPTTSPSALPTAVPSKSPTEMPSITPSASPTKTPSSTPSITPSTEPSKAPTANGVLPSIVWDVMAYFSDSYLEMYVEVNNNVQIHGNAVECDNIFLTLLNGEENTKLLNGATCTFTNHIKNVDIIITLSSLSTVSPNHNNIEIFIKPDSFLYTRIEDQFQNEYTFSEVHVSFNPLSAFDPTPPNIVLAYAPTIGLCDVATVDARSTTNLGGRSAYFTWTMVNSYPNDLNSQWNLPYVARNGSGASVLSDLDIDASSTLEIELTVESWFGETAITMFNITKLNDATPVIILRASPSVFSASNQNNEGKIDIVAYITYNTSCVASINDDYALEWSVNPSTSSLQLYLDSLANRDQISIPSRYLSPGHTYDVQVELLSEAFSSYSSSVAFVYDLSPIQCQIASSDSITLDAISINQMQSFELALDGDTFTFDYDASNINNKSHFVWNWSCFKQIETEELQINCGDLLHQNTRSQTVVFEDETYEVEKTYHYYIHMEVQDIRSPFRSSCNDSVELVVPIIESSDDSIQILSVSISTITTNIHWNDKLRFITDVSNWVNDGQIAQYNWTETTQLLSDDHDVNTMNENEQNNGNLILSTTYLEQGNSYSFKLFVEEYNDENAVIAYGSSAVQIYINHGPFIVDNSFVIDSDTSCQITYDSLYDALTIGHTLSIAADADYRPLSYLFSYSFNTDQDLLYTLHSSLSSQSFIQNVLLPIGEFTIFAEVYDSQSNQAMRTKSCEVSVDNGDDKECPSYKQIFDEYLDETIIRSSHDILLFLLRSSQIYIEFMSLHDKRYCVQFALSEVIEIVYDELIVNTRLNIDMCANSEYTIPFAHVLSTFLLMEHVQNNDKIFDLIHTALDPCDLIQNIESLDALYLDTDSIITNVPALYYEQQNIIALIPQITRTATASNLFYSFISSIVSFMQIPSNRPFKTEILDLFDLAYASLYIHSLLQLSVSIPGEPLNIDGFGVSIFGMRVSPNASSSLNMSVHNISIEFDSELFGNDKCSKNAHINSKLCSVDIITIPIVLHSESIPLESTDPCNEGMVEVSNNTTSDLNAVSIQLIGSDFNLSSLPSNITITFPFNSSLNPNELGCVWYDEVKDVWSHDGCTSYVDLENSIIHCVCNHLTIFSTVRNIHYDDHLICNVFNDTNWRYAHILFAILFIILFCHFCLELLPFIITCKYSLKFLFSKHSQLFILLFGAIICILNTIVCLMFSHNDIVWSDANIALLTCLYMLPLPFYFMIFSQILIAWQYVADALMRPKTSRILRILCVIYLLVPVFQVLFLLLSPVQSKYVVSFDIFWTITMLLSAVSFLIYGYKMVSVIATTAKMMVSMHGDSTEISLARKLSFIAVIIVLFFVIQSLLAFYFLFDFNQVTLEWRVVDLSSHVVCLMIIGFMYHAALNRLRLELSIDSWTCCSIMKRHKIQIGSTSTSGNVHVKRRLPTITAEPSVPTKMSKDQSYVTETKVELSSQRIEQSVTDKKEVFAIDLNGKTDEKSAANVAHVSLGCSDDITEPPQTMTYGHEEEGINKETIGEV